MYIGIRHQTVGIFITVCTVYVISIGGFGDWDTSGCQLDEASSTADLSVCRCNHLTDFSVLLVNSCRRVRLIEYTIHLETSMLERVDV